ncbi:MAG: penicillin-binding protein [Bacteroidales bacterium]|nr:penicillin-binding protein [Bacteroidales bacterium]
MAKKKQKKDSKKPFISKFFIILWSLLALGILACVLIFSLISNGKIGYMPPIEELQNPKNKFATEVYTADGKLLTTYYMDTDNRVSVEYEQLSPHLVKALLATEDVRFTKHSGIDFKALFRAIVKRGILGQKSAGGGSTLTQQLAKQLYTPTAESSFERLLQKPIEWVIAVKLERFYTKEEIMTMYLNKFDFLYNAVGIKNAAQVYFNTTPEDLSIEQAATLVGMFKNPSLYNPIRRKDNALSRRNLVLNQMVVADYLSQAEGDSLQALPLVTDYQRISHTEGLAPYFRQYLRVMMMHSKPERKNYASWQDQLFYDDSVAWDTDPLFGWCKKNKKKDGSHYNIYTDGLKIYTTIDSRMQQYAEEAVYEHIALNLQPKFFLDKNGRS